LARGRPQELDERDAENGSSASIGGWLIFNHWLWLGVLVPLGWKLGGASSMVRTVLGAIAILVIIEFSTRLLQFRRRFNPISRD
jgi:hypothetical protein